MYAASAPALKPFFKRYIEKMSSGAEGSKNHNQVYLVRSDGHGGMGRVERILVSKKRNPEAYLELSSDQKSDSQIVKSVEFEVEQYGQDIEALPDVRGGPSQPIPMKPTTRRS